MSNRYIGGFIRPGYDLLKVPNAPTIGAVTAGDTQVSVAFTAPSCVGGGAITSYTAYTSCNRSAASNTTSPVVVTGLTNGTSYTFRVIANNAYGPSSPSGVSASATPSITTGQQAFTTAGSFTWVAPTGVTSVSMVAVGGGGSGGYCLSGCCYRYGGGGGGGLGYKNNYSVTPGTSYNVVVGANGVVMSGGQAGGDSYFVSTATVKGGGGGRGLSSGGTAGTYTGDGGGNGGTGGDGNYEGGFTVSGGGAGAGGYAGNGGNGSTAGGLAAGTSGAGGGGAGGGYTTASSLYALGGGGVGILGQGSNGSYSSTQRGGGGSGGTGGGSSRTGGAYGGGGGRECNGAVGAVRIIWPGTTRSFPSTNTGDL